MAHLRELQQGTQENNNVVSRIKTAVERAGITETDLIKSLQMPYTTWRDLITGVTKRPERLPEIAQALQVSFEWLLFGVGPMERSVPVDRSALEKHLSSLSNAELRAELQAEIERRGIAEQQRDGLKSDLDAARQEVIEWKRRFDLLLEKPTRTSGRSRRG